MPAAAAAAAAVPGRPPTMAVPAPVEGRAATLAETCAGKAGVPRVADAVAMVEVGGQAGGGGAWWARERRVVVLERTHLQLVLPFFRLGTRGALFRLFGRDDSGLRLGIRLACLRLEVNPATMAPIVCVTTVSLPGSPGSPPTQRPTRRRPQLQRCRATQGQCREAARPPEGG